MLWDVSDNKAAGSAVFRGSNQSGLRNYNERLVLSVIQRFGPKPGVEIAGILGLSSQTVSVILRSLEADGLVKRGTPKRGRVGKPSIPMMLNPSGAFSLGLKIGRRSADLILIDMRGATRAHSTITYRYPMPNILLDFVDSGMKMCKETLSARKLNRIAGIGIAKPFEIWNWHETIGAPIAELEAWKTFDFEGAIGAATGLPVFVENDATAACRAENIYGRGREFRDFAYFFVGAFIGGGVVLNHSIFEGVHGNAGAFGSLPAFDTLTGGSQLIDAGSLYVLERDLEQRGIDPVQIWNSPHDWSGFEEPVELWIERSALHLARAAITTCAVIDFEAVLIDGAFPETVRHRLVERVRALVPQLDVRGLYLPRIEEGMVGRNARALGAGSVPIFAHYLINTNGNLTSV